MAALIGSLVLIVSPGASGATMVLGTQALGPNSDYNPPGWAEAFPSVASASASVDTLTVYVDAGSTASSLVAGLYADASGAPGSLLAQGSRPPVAGAWNDVSIPTVSLTAGKTYWIAVLGPAGTLYYRDSCCTSGGTSYVSSATNLTSLPGAWSGTTTYKAGPVTAYANAKDKTPPSTPSGLNVTAASATSVTLSWTASTDDRGVTGYDAYLGATKAGTATTTSYTYSGLTCGTSYTLGVDAYDAAGNVSPKATLAASTSACAATAGAVGTQTVGPTADYNPPGWAEAFSATASATGAISGLRVYVDAPSTASSLVAGLYADASGAPGALIAQGSVTPTAGAWNNVPLSGVSVTAGKTYWIAVLGKTGTLYYRDSCCTSGSKAYVSSATNLTALPGAWAGTTSYNASPISAYAYSPSSDTAAPTTPGGLKTTASTQTSVSLSWTASTDNVGVTGYGVYVNGSLTGSSSSLSYTASSLACGTTYTFAVDATDAAGNRSSRASVSASTAACTGGPGPSFFVATNGSDSNPCTKAAPCSSFDRAYHVAAGGQTVEIAAGSYGSQTLTADSSKQGPGVVTFQPASGVNVSTSGLYVEGASYVTFSGFSGGSRLQVQNTNPGVLGSTNVTFKSMTASTIRIVGRVSNVTISGGSFGSTVDNQPQVKKYNQSDSETSRPSNILVDGAFFHDFTRSGSSVHTECFQILNANGLTIRNSRFNHCDGTGDIGITDGPIDNLTIENNFLGSVGDAYYAVQITKNTRNLIFRYNTSAKAIIFSDTEVGGPYSVIGNYMPYNPSTCTSGASYSHNVLNGGTCGATDLQVSSMKFANEAAFDLHLAPGSEAINHGDPGNMPAADIDGEGRPRGTAPDAGADEAG